MMKKGKSIKRKSIKKGRTMKKRGSISNDCKEKIIKMFIEMLNSIKIYHWKTRSYSQHKATDELYEKLNNHIDKFIEIMLGKDESRIQLISKHTELYDFSNTFSFKERIYEYHDFLNSMDLCIRKEKDGDLLNIRDEILGDINQFLYLLTFTK